MKVVILTILLTFSLAIPSWATTWEYRIANIDTPTIIDTDKTDAVVDTDQNEIRLPRFAPNTVAFWPDGSPDYVVATPTEIVHYSWDGSSMVENTILSIPGQSNPLALAAPAPYPDVVVVDQSGAKHYSFTGSQMVENPALSAAGLAGVLSVGARDTTIAGLVGDEVQAYTSGSRNVSLEPSVSLSNPIGMALYPDQNNMVVLEKDRVRFFMNTGTEMIENPTLIITGLNSPKAIGVGDNFDTAIIEGNDVKHYSFDGSQLRYNNVLTVDYGLGSPSAVALRPGSYDRVIVDGDEVKYYSYNETLGQLVYDADRSITAAGLSNLGGYVSSANAVSQVKDPGVDTTHVRIRAYCIIPESTSITWSMTTDGANFTKAWRVRNESGGTICETTPDNGGTWNPIGEVTQAFPSSETKELWIELLAGRSIAWKAELATTDPKNTPKIKAPTPGEVAVLWQAGNPPNTPIVDLPDVCYTSTTPTINWTFSDPDPGDTQSAFQAVIKKLDGTLVYDTGQVGTPASQFKIPSREDPDTPGPLWASGDYEFNIQIRTFDSLGIPSSDWSDPEYFCVVGFERPRIKELGAPAVGQAPPDPGDTSTHLVIEKGMAEGELPLTKAGGKVGLLVDSIGPLNNIEVLFPYITKEGQQVESTVHKIENTNGTGSPTNRWYVEFWTSANLEICPDDTVVDMDLLGTSPEGNTRLSTVNAPLHSAGVVKTKGTVYEDWFVVLQGRKR